MVAQSWNDRTRGELIRSSITPPAISTINTTPYRYAPPSVRDTSPSDKGAFVSLLKRMSSK